MNRSTFTQSGELVTISRLKNKEKWKFLRSLRFRITVILVIIGIVPCVILEKSIVNSYEDRAVSVRSITVKNQCDIICNQLIQQNYMEDPGSDVINGQLSMLTNIYGGRILIIDQDFRVIKDTYDMDRGKTIISQEVIQSFQGKETSQYDRKNSYLEMTVRIQNTETKETLGVMLVSISTDEIRANMKILETKGMTILSIIALLVLVFGYLLAGILMKPFQKVTRSIEDITDGYLDESISVPDYLETELITDAFNKMLTRVRTLDDSRQEFVSNVSHELKTPLASMKVLADSLNGQEGVPVELYQEFMQDITSEIDRENQIITDLLSLVKMDKKVADLNITQVNINELLEQLLKRLHPIAAQKNVELILDSFRPVNAEVDATKLSLAFSNLIENGIKYNNENGWVRVSLNADHKYFLLLFPYDTRLLHISYSRNLSILYDTKFHSKKQDKFIRLMPDFCPTEPYAGYPKTAPLHFSPPRPYSSAHQPREEQISGGDGGCSGSLLNRYSVKSRDNTVLPHTPSERKMQGFPPDTDWAGLSVRRFLSCGKGR